MKNITRHTGTLQITERMRNSINGNPRFRCAIVTGANSCVTFVTKPDCAHSYDIQNHDGKAVDATIGTHYGVATLDTIREGA